MTVVAYSARHRILATDSRCSDENGSILTSCQKLYRLKSGALLGLSGEADDRDVVRLLETATARKMPSRAQLVELKNDFSGIIVFPGGQVYTVASEFYEHTGSHGEWTGEVLAIEDPYAAVGCGADFALGAMEAGKSPVQAVRIACKRNSYCALPVQWRKL